MIDKNNKSFCAVPFVSTMINVDTTVRYCCMVKGALNKLKKPDDTFFTCKDNFVQDAWNSTDMKAIRINMIDGNKISGCKPCYDQEENGRISNRQHSVLEWNWLIGEERLNSLVEQALDNNGALDDSPVYLDLRLGNLCNLKCRMCNPWNSSQILKEHIELTEKNPEYNKVWMKTFGKLPIDIQDDQKWFDHDIMWDQVISLIPKLKKVYMTGGEPTLIKNNFKFMKRCIEENRQDMLLFFNTNCTNINKNFLELISQFNRVNINASIDGIGIVNEYIRSPSNWTQISANVEKLASMPGVHLGVTPTIQVDNVFNIVKMLRWVEELNIKYNRKIHMDFLVNIHPFHLNVNILSDDLRAQALNEIQEYISEGMLNHDLATVNSLNGIIGLLQQSRAHDYEEQIARYKTYTLGLDAERSQDHSVLDSRLSELLL
jgi:MoaA/NifB/PqqE/SkfB family radical SAM enzyme